MELFDIEGGNIVLNPNSLYIPEFKKIWDRDKTKKKDKATAEIAYITFKHNLSNDNPYLAYPEKEKEGKLKKDIFDDEQWEPDELIQKAEIRYREFQNTHSARLLHGARSAADKLAEYFENIDFNKLDNYGRPVYSAKELSGNLKDVSNIVKSLKQLQEQVEKEQMEAKTARGDVEIGMYEVPNKE